MKPMGLFNSIHQSLKRVASGWRAARELRRVSGVIPAGDEPIVISVLRNEMLRLPQFIEHYRSLGIKKFVIVDNNSTDGTREYLSTLSDVLLYTTEAHFLGKERWVNFLLKRHGLGRWCLIVDADEILEYPHTDRVPVPKLCQYLEEIGANALHAILLDLYPKGPLSEVGYKRGENYFFKEWYFDSFESMARTPRHFHRGTGLDHRFIGGVRKRVFGVAPCCSKFPLLRYERGMFLSDGQHYLEGGRFPEFRAVLYHFKYLQDFEDHVFEEVRRGQHWQGAAEYRIYAERMRQKTGGMLFRNSDSILLRGAAQLKECGYLVAPDSFMDFASKQVSS
jgi:glycosyltransferase involved in cell wall biosynthesis